MYRLRFLRCSVSCISYLTGLSPSKDDKKCTKYENCKETIFNVCIKCENGYYLNKKEEKCILQTEDLMHCKEVMDGKTCNICEDDFFFDEEKKCIDTNYCQASDEFGICEKCL